jgi:SAM-dependent methyltransferase
MDAGHLRDEEHLACMMRKEPSTPKQEFILSQWRFSKQEFWGMVKDNVSPPPKSLLNVGSGDDRNFRQFEKAGYIFVNFDIVYNMLHALQKDFGAKSCVAGEIGSLPFKKNAFDYVVSVDVIHHEKDDVRVPLRSLRDVLKPGGRLFLEDPNSWGMFQMAKSVLPRPLHGILRTTYHRLRRSTHGPADYEFPTSPWRVKRALRELGFRRIRVYPNDAYPCIGKTGYGFYRLFKNLDWVRKYHNYHYMLSAEKAD